MNSIPDGGRNRCPECNAECQAKARFCWLCGRPLRTEPDAEITCGKYSHSLANGALGCFAVIGTISAMLIAFVVGFFTVCTATLRTWTGLGIPEYPFQRGLFAGIACAGIAFVVMSKMLHSSDKNRS